MKKSLLAALCLLVCSAAVAQPIYWDEGRYLSLELSYSHKVLGGGTFDTGTLELACFPDPEMGWEMTSSFEFGKDYISFEPLSLLGTMLVFVTQLGNSDADGRLAALMLAVTAGRIPIYPVKWMEIVPYWNLLKFTMMSSVYDEMKFSGDVGLRLRFFPFESYLSWYDTFFISPFVQYDFGYKDDNFKGHSIGVIAGIYF